jgi:ankyrin repeat protein
MKVIRRVSVFLWAAFCLLLFSAGTARAQSVPHSYLFLEVKDAAGQPVADAEVNASGDETFGPVPEYRRKLLRGLKTDAAGNATGRIYSGFVIPSEFRLQVSKPGFLPYEDIVSSRPHRSFGVESPIRHSYWRHKVVLLKNPATGPERRAVEREQRRRLLLLAVKRGDAAHVRRLLREGVSAHAADAQGVPAVAWAALMGHAEVIDVLLDAGADVRDKHSLGHQSLVVYLDTSFPYCRNRAADRKDEAGRELCDEIIRKLIRAGAAVNPENPVARPTLHIANEHTPYNMSFKSFKALVEAGARTDVLTEQGLTTLMLATYISPPEVVKALIDAGVPVNARNKQGQTTLIYAAQHSRLGASALKLLIEAGADLNAADNDGRTALMQAAAAPEYEGLEKVALLLASGAKADAVDKHGLTALKLAQGAGNVRVVGLLEAAGLRR